METHEGRVTKVEGNPDHPISHGNLCARGQASVQGLYHPDRITNPVVRESVTDTPVTWSTAERLLAQHIQQAGPGRVVLLSQNYSGTMDRLADARKSMAQAEGQEIDNALAVGQAARGLHPTQQDPMQEKRFDAAQGERDAQRSDRHRYEDRQWSVEDQDRQAEQARQEAARQPG